jgi:hypothetical protein
MTRPQWRLVATLALGLVACGGQGRQADGDALGDAGALAQDGDGRGDGSSSHPVPSGTEDGPGGTDRGGAADHEVEQPTDAAAETGTDLPPGTNGDTAGAEECGPARPLLIGAAPVIDAFPVKAGIIVVRAGSLAIVSRGGAVLKEVPVPREITTAELGAAGLYVADRARLTLYARDLTEVGGILLKEACATSVLLDDGRFICATGEGRGFGVYRLDPPELLSGTDDRAFYDGWPVYTIPGTSYFVSSRFALWKLDAANLVKSVTTTFASGSASRMVAFYNSPPTHVINSAGALYRILGNGCDGTTSAEGMGCLGRDGTLGTETGGHGYVALTSDAQGVHAFGLVGTGGGDLPCAAGCTLQRIDIAKRLVVSERRHLLDVTTIRSMHHDADCGGVIVVHQKGSVYPPGYPSSQPSSYGVSRLDDGS